MFWERLCYTDSARKHKPLLPNQESRFLKQHLKPAEPVQWRQLRATHPDPTLKSQSAVGGGGEEGKHKAK